MTGDPFLILGAIMRNKLGKILWQHPAHVLVQQNPVHRYEKLFAASNAMSDGDGQRSEQLQELEMGRLLSFGHDRAELRRRTVPEATRYRLRLPQSSDRQPPLRDRHPVRLMQAVLFQVSQHLNTINQ